MKKSSHREVMCLMRGLGLQVLEMRHNGRGHMKAQVLSPLGNRFMVTFANTPSDWRHLLNQKAWIKQRIRELDGPLKPTLPHQLQRH